MDTYLARCWMHIHWLPNDYPPTVINQWSRSHYKCSLQALWLITCLKHTLHLLYIHWLPTFHISVASETTSEMLWKTQWNGIKHTLQSLYIHWLPTNCYKQVKPQSLQIFTSSTVTHNRPKTHFTFALHSLATQFSHLSSQWKWKYIRNAIKHTLQSPYIHWLPPFHISVAIEMVHITVTVHSHDYWSSYCAAQTTHT